MNQKKGNVFSLIGKYAASFVMALAMVFLIAGPASPVPLIPEAHATGTTSIFDMVGNDGSVNPSNGGVTTTDGGGTAYVIKTLMSKGKAIGTGVFGLGTIIAVIFLTIHIIKFIGSADNDMARKQAQKGLLWSLVGLGLMGGMTMFIGFGWNLFTGT